MKLLSTAAVLAVALAATPAAAQSWTGPHVGAFVGMNSLKSDTRDTYEEVFYDAPSIQKNKVAGGIFAGYDYQIDDNFVIGVEGDIGNGIGQTIRIQDGDSYYGYTSAKLKRMATLRARTGLAMGNTMAFITGGVAFAKGRFDLGYIYENYDYDYNAPVSKNLSGYTLGGGIEHRFANKVGVRAEFSHTQFGTETSCFRDIGSTDLWCDDQNDYYTARYTPSLNSARIGVSYNF